MFPFCSCTGIVHSAPKLDSLYNLIFRQSIALASSAAKCPSKFAQSLSLFAFRFVAKT